MAAAEDISTPQLLCGCGLLRRRELPLDEVPALRMLERSLLHRGRRTAVRDGRVDRVEELGAKGGREDDSAASEVALLVNIVTSLPVFLVPSLLP